MPAWTISVTSLWAGVGGDVRRKRGRGEGGGGGGGGGEEGAGRRNGVHVVGFLRKERGEEVYFRKKGMKYA